MRYAVLAALVALALPASAGEAIEVEPRVRVPGESPTLTVSESLLKALSMSPDDVKAVHKETERLNGERKKLFKAAGTAKKGLLAAQQEVDKATAALAQQEADLNGFIRQRLAQDQQAEYAVRRQLQPVVDWLKLTNEQVTQLVAKQKDMVDKEQKLRKELEDQLKALQAREAPAKPEDHKKYADDRKAYTDRLREYAALTQAWLTNVESVLTDEQKQTWRSRYRRTAYPVEGLGPAAPAPAPKE